jgi:hypothetical protein
VTGIVKQINRSNGGFILPGAKEIEIRSRTSAEERIPLAPPPAR